MIVCNCYVCRAEYDPKSDLLDSEFMLKGKWFQRKDVEVWFWIDGKFVILLKELDCLFP